MAIGGRLDGGAERYRVLRTAQTLAAGALAAEVGVVDLDDVVEPLVTLLFEHHLDELVLHELRRAVADTEMAPQLESANMPVLVCVGRYIASNQMVSRRLPISKAAQIVSLV